jgi:hypothetical protein
VELLENLPIGVVRLAAVPEPILRRLFDGFHLQVTYDRHNNWATIQVTVREDDLDELRVAAHAALHPDQPPTSGGQGLDMADRGIQPASFSHAFGIPGATQAGKTTLLNCLASTIPPRERLVTCEEAQVRCTRSKSVSRSPVGTLHMQENRVWSPADVGASWRRQGRKSV